MSLRGASYLERTSTAAGGERGVAGVGDRHGNGVIHSNQHSGLRGKFEVFAFARDDVSGAAGKTEAEAARGMAEHRTDEGPAPGTDGRPDHAALALSLSLTGLACFTFHALAGLSAG